MNTKNILVTGGRAPSTLHLVRLLHKQGYRVYIADSIKYYLTSFSNSVEKSYIIHSPRFETKKFIDDLKNIINKHQIEIIFPTCEEIFYISQYKDELEDLEVNVFTEHINVLNELHNKYHFYLLMNKLNIPTPQTKKADIVNVDKKYIFKPIYSRFSSNIHFKLSDIPEGERKDYIAQEFIKGNQYCVYGIANKGKFELFSIYKTEMTAGQGATISFKSIKDKDIEEYSKKIIEHYNFSGQIAFDVMKDSQGTPYFIECNPRLTSGIHLYKSMNDLYPNGKPTQLRLAMFLYLLSNSKKNTFSKTMKQFIKHKDVIFSKKDIKPTFFQFISYGYLTYKSMKEKKDILEITTADIEWNGEK